MGNGIETTNDEFTNWTNLRIAIPATSRPNTPWTAQYPMEGSR
jgi:hypothetical protein